MLRVDFVIAVALLAMLAGCKSVPKTSVIDASAISANSKFVQTVESSPPRRTSPAMHESQPDEPLTLADLECIAFQNNPALATAAAQMEAARGRQIQSRLFPNPVAGYHGTEIGNRGTSGQQGGFVSQRFVTGGKLRLDHAIAGKEVDEASLLLEAQHRRVLSDVRVRFYEALVAQRQYDLTEDLARIGDEMVQATRTLLRGRLATENDLLQAQIKADETHILFENARNESMETWRRLAAVAGVPTMQIGPLVGAVDSELPKFEWDRCYQRVVDNNPELHAARTRVERASIVLRRAKRERIPNVDLSVSVRHHNITDSDVANAQLGIPIPIFDRNQGNIRAAEAQWVAACNNVKRLELDLQDRLAVAFRRYSNARQQVERYSQSMVPRAKRSLELVSDGYEKGQVKYVTLLIAQQTNLQVNLAYLDSLRMFWSSATAIEGQLLTGSLAANRARNSF